MKKKNPAFTFQGLSPQKKPFRKKRHCVSSPRNNKTVRGVLICSGGISPFLGLLLSEFRPRLLRFRSDGSPPSDHGLCFPLRWRSFPRPVGSMLLMLLTLFLCNSAKFRIFCSISNLAFQAFVMYRNYCGISEKDAPPVRRGLLLFFSGASMAFPELSGACTVSSSRRRSRPQDNKIRAFKQPTAVVMPLYALKSPCLFCL